MTKLNYLLGVANLSLWIVNVEKVNTRLLFLGRFVVGSRQVGPMTLCSAANNF